MGGGGRKENLGVVNGGGNGGSGVDGRRVPPRTAKNQASLVVRGNKKIGKEKGKKSVSETPETSSHASAGVPATVDGVSGHGNDSQEEDGALNVRPLQSIEAGQVSCFLNQATCDIVMDDGEEVLDGAGVFLMKKGGLQIDRQEGEGSGGSGNFQ